MLRCQRSVALFRVAIPFIVLLFPPVAAAADKSATIQGGKVGGILIDKHADWITVKADGEDKPVKYLVAKSDRRLARALKGIFDASRVQLTYKKKGEARQLIGIRKQILRVSGIMRGKVVKVYNSFWVEVKPARGPSDAFAPGANYNDKAFMALLRGLKKGDVVTIKFYTDFERHRILALRKN